jgi:uncharacterized protein YoxC
MDWAQILVIILSVFLAIFLLLGIILAILLIRVTRQIKDVTESAQRTVHGFEHMVNGFNKVTSPAIIGKILFDQFNKVRDRTKKGKK